jgi:protein TonB
MKMSATNEGVLQQGNSDIVGKHQRSFKLPTPDASRNTAFFATTILDESASARGKRAAQAGLALAVQAAIVGALLIVPLLFTQGLDLYNLNNTILVAPPPPAAPSPPAVHAQTAAPKQTFIHPQLTAPTIVPKKIVESASDAGPAAPAVNEMAGGVPGGMGDVLGGSLAGPPPPPPSAAPARPKGPLRISSGMQEPKLLYAPPVEYSPIARQARVQGTVILDAIIDERGNVTEVKVISGPALLFPSALKAVSERRYAPTIFDGEPTAVRLNVRVEFHLS